MSDTSEIKEFIESWAMLDGIADQYQETLDKRRNYLKASRSKIEELSDKYREAQEALKVAKETLSASFADQRETLKTIDDELMINFADAEKCFRIMNRVIPNQDIREHTIWKLSGYGWHNSSIMKGFEISEDELKAIILRKTQETLHTMPYKEYLQTPEWKERRLVILERDEYRCVVCNSSERLNVHHRDYTRRGYELDTDLVTLCQGCHQVFHENSRLAKVEA